MQFNKIIVESSKDRNWEIWTKVFSLRIKKVQILHFDRTSSSLIQCFKLWWNNTFDTWIVLTIIFIMEICIFHSLSLSHLMPMTHRIIITPSNKICWKSTNFSSNSLSEPLDFMLQSSKNVKISNTQIYLEFCLVNFLHNII